jgi:hypothetical protein
VIFRTSGGVPITFLNRLKGIRNKKVMRFESRRGLKKKQKTKRFVTWKAYFSYFSSC